jgi:putative peptidoglycan lipid II flippase
VSGLDDRPDVEDAAGGPDALVRNSAVMAAGTVVSRVLGFARSAVVAAALGTALTASTFTVANTVPNIIYILLAGGVLNAVFVPQLVRAMKEGAERSRAYTDGLLTVAGVLLLFITVAATAAAPLVVGAYTGGTLAPDDRTVATLFAFWCLPQIFFYGLYTMLGQVLTARGSFGPMMWAPIVNNLVAIVTGLAFIARFTVADDEPSSLSTVAIAFLGAGTTLGVALQAVVLVPVLRRTGFGWRPRFRLRGLGLRRAGDLARWTFLFVLVNQLAYLVIVNLGVRADVEAKGVLGYGVGYAAYANAYLVFLLPHSIITVSVVTGLLPQLSRDAADGRADAVRDQLSWAWRLTAVAVVPAAAALVALGTDVTGVVFSGAGAPDARHVGLILGALALGLPAFSAQYIALRGFYAYEDTRTPFLLQVGIASTNVALALAAYSVLPLRLKMVGVAAAYALTYAAGLALSTAVLRRRVGDLDGATVVRTYARLMLVAAAAGGAAWTVAWLVGRWLGDGLAGSAASLAGGGAVLLSVYVLGARLLRVGIITRAAGKQCGLVTASWA